MFLLQLNSNLVSIDLCFSTLLTVLSIVIVCFGFYTALTCNERIGYSILIPKNIWLTLASLAMGTGIWTMHFIGMGAMELPVEMAINWNLTVISIIPAFIATFLAFYFINQPRKSLIQYILASTLMGTGITGMHYIGMESMVLEGVIIEYNPILYALSVMFSICISFFGLYFYPKNKKIKNPIAGRFIASLIFGLATSGMHYISIVSMSFSTTPDKIKDHGHVEMTDMAFIMFLVAFGITVILFLFLLTIIADQLIEKRFRFYDSQTKLFNFNKLLKRDEENKKAKAMGVWYFQNIDDINVEYGFLFVDRFLSYFGKNILQENMPALTDLYRTDGNHFAFVAKDEKASNELFEYMNNLSAKLKQGILFEGELIKLKGICAYTETKETSLLKKLYSNAQAVIKHYNTQLDMQIISYNSAIHTKNFSQQILADLPESMERNHLYLVFQPKVDPKSKKIVSLEALIRWNHPIHGFLSPAVFIPILEANAQMIDLTNWIIEEVCKQLKAWKEMAYMPKQVGINIPGQYLTSKRLITVLNEKTALYQIPHEQLELEITETYLVKSLKEAQKAVGDLRKEGFSVALDDFGTGVSSLAYLREIPISTLKIDKSFVDEVPGSIKAEAILQSMLEMSKLLNVMVVVEGIEKEIQKDYLEKQNGTILIQGYFYSRPLPVEELKTWCMQFYEEHK